MKRRLIITAPVQVIETAVILRRRRRAHRLTDRDTITFEGDFEFEVEDLAKYVQVQYIGGGTSRSTYTYRDPSGTLEVGDLVEVDALGKSTLAKVVELGRCGYFGPVKAVTAMLERTVL